MPTTRRSRRREEEEEEEPPPPAGKRVVTSAIPDMSVTEVRRALDSIRKRWATRADAAHPPFVISAPMDCGSRDLRMDEFAFEFILGHHRKRHAKSKSKQ